MSEANSRIDIIDFNYNPAFSDIEINRQRNAIEYFSNKSLVKKILEKKISTKSLPGFAQIKEISVQLEHRKIFLSFGMISREFQIKGIDAREHAVIQPGNYLITSADGQNQKMHHPAQSWWDEGYLGRVIKCTSTNDPQNKEGEVILFLTKSTQSVFKDQVLSVNVIWLEDFEMEEFFDYLEIGDILQIKSN